MTLTALRHIFFTLLLAVSLIPCGSVRSQVGKDADSIPPEAPVTFEEIELSATGVIAYDTAGVEWRYDFDLERFVLGGPDISGESDGGEAGRGEEVMDPVELRCTSEKTVDRPALKAVFVGYDEYVDGDITAYGRVTVKGWVRGSIQSYKRPVLVTATGQVDGDISAPEIEVRDGGVVLGRTIIIGRPSDPSDVIASDFASAGMWVVIAFTIALTLISFLVSTLAPKAVDSMAECARNYPVRAPLVGLGFLFLAPVIAALVIMTIIGVLVSWLVPIAYLVAFAMGMSVLGVNHCGPLVARLAGMRPGRILNSQAGVLVFMILWAIVALLLGARATKSGVTEGLGIFLLVVAIVATCYPLFLGIGVAVLTRFGRRTYPGPRTGRAVEQRPAPAPAPPPMPVAPPPVSRPTSEGGGQLRRPPQP
jgi:hypothetical protein